MIDPEALAGELKSLRKGRATWHPRLMDRIGPQLRGLCGITDSDTAAGFRKKLTTVTQRLLVKQPEEIQVAVLAALALHPQADQGTLDARERWLAARFHVHERTARRRVDDGFRILVELAAADNQQVDDADVAEWRVRSLDAILRLDTDRPQVTERRVIVAAAAVDEIVHRVSVPVIRPNGAQAHDLECEALYGAWVTSCERPTDDHFVYRLALSKALRVGDTHEYQIRFQIPDGQVMASHYVMQPLNPCDSFDLTIHFPPQRTPREIWRIDGVAPRLVDSEKPTGPLLRPDGSGELRISFLGLRQGRAYGVKWKEG